MSSYLSPNSERDLRRRASRRRGAREEPALERVVVGAGACRERLASTGRQGILARRRSFGNGGSWPSTAVGRAPSVAPGSVVFAQGQCATSALLKEGPGRTRPQDGAGSRGRRAARLRRNQPEPRRTSPRTSPDGRRNLEDGATLGAGRREELLDAMQSSEYRSVRYWSKEINGTLTGERKK